MTPRRQIRKAPIEYGAAFAAPHSIIVTDASGCVIFSNDAALPCGADAFGLVPGLVDAIDSARFFAPGIFAPIGSRGGYDADLSHYGDGVIILRSGDAEGGALQNADIIFGTGAPTALVSAAYERVITSRLKRDSLHIRDVALTRIVDSVSSLLSHLYPVMRGAVCRIDSDVCDGSLVITDTSALTLAVAAMCSAVTFVSRGVVNVKIEHRDADAVITVCAERRRGVCGDGLAVFGARAVDAVFACDAARECGHKIEMIQTGVRLGMSLTARANDYYPSWLKQSRSLYIFGSAEEQNDEHDEQLVVDAAHQKQNAQAAQQQLLRPDFA